MNSLLRKNWISPFVGFSFFIVSMTGLLMFMHVRSHAISRLHEWIGILFMITATFHLIVNRRVFLSHFRKKDGAVALAAVLLFAIIFTISGLTCNHDHSGESGWKGGRHYHRR